MKQARLKILQKIPIFGGIRDDILKFLLRNARTVSIPKNGFFFQENDKGDSMFVLEKGKVAILKTCKRHQYLLKYLEKGDCFGEMELIDLCPRSASILAIEDCSAIELSSTTLHKLYKKDLEQFAMFHMNMGREVSRRLREANKHLFEAKVEAKASFNGDYIFY